MDTHTSGNFGNLFGFHLLHQNQMSPFGQYCFFKNLYRPTFVFNQTLVRKVVDNLIWRTVVQTSLDLDHGIARYGLMPVLAWPPPWSPLAWTRQWRCQVSPASARPPPATPQPTTTSPELSYSSPTPATSSPPPAKHATTRRSPLSPTDVDATVPSPPPEPSPAAPCQRRPPGVR